MAKKKKLSKLDKLVVKVDDAAQLWASKELGILMEKKAKDRIDGKRKNAKK